MVTPVPPGGWTPRKTDGSPASCIICATPRSGSTYLCDLLRSTSLVGFPAEYLSPVQEVKWSATWQAGNPVEYYRWMLASGTSSNGVFGIKLIWSHMDHIRARLQAMTGLQHVRDPDLLSAAFPNPHYVFIRRRNLVRQAISLHRANHTGIWVLPDGDTGPRSEPVFDYTILSRYVHYLADMYGAWERFFVNHSIRPLEVVYEDMVRDPAQTVAGVVHLMSVPQSTPIIVGPTRMRRQSDDTTEEWVRRFHDMERAQGLPPSRPISTRD